MKQVWKRRAVVAAVLMLVGTSVYLNWKEALDYLGYYLNMLQQQPEIYARISKELMVQI